MNHPDITLLMTDQLRWDCLKYVGHPDVKTLYLDTLAAAGISFDHTYSACLGCVAAGAALHTRMEQSYRGRADYQDDISWEYEHTLARELAQAGYYTRCVGKTHVRPLGNYLGFHNAEPHDGYLGYSRRANILYQESQLMVDDYFYQLRDELGVSADMTDTGIERNDFVARPWIHEEKYHPTN